VKNQTEVLLYEASDFPVFQNRMYETADEARSCPKGNIQIVQNRSTGLVYNRAFDPAQMIYDSNYQNEQGVSELFRKHLLTVADIIEQNIGRESIAEIGCGKGSFLELLLDRGCDVLGFDPTYEGNNPRVKQEYFASTYGTKFKGFVMRHVLEHVSDPVSMLQKIRGANGGAGKIYIEVPCLDWIMEHNAWYDLFYEHVNYFRLSDFSRMFGTVYESGRIFGGQYLYVVADLSSLRTPMALESDHISRESFVRFDFNFTIPPGPDHAIWGGASKGVIFALLASRRGINFETVIDLNPAKQGKYLAATGLFVTSPSEALVKLSPNATIYVMNSNYFDEIKSLSGNKCKHIRIDVPAT
jgi:SAM-dependent methyltransferase